ncbi:MAG: ASCH domain-containing protein [Minwuiales bacterium]|nr:ASCH domain-containing protein [Minwuiales bacterium]
MKALTLWQPWATLIALGIKGFETRGWSTRYRGPLAIHAAKRRVDRRQFDDYLWPVLAGFDYIGEPRPDIPWPLPTGCVVAVCELVDVIPTEQIRVIEDEADWDDFGQDRGAISPAEHYLGNYEPGRFAWDCRKVRRLRQPIAARGAQGLWEWEYCNGLEFEAPR